MTVCTTPQCKREATFTLETDWTGLGEFGPNPKCTQCICTAIETAASIPDRVHITVRSKEEES